MQSIRQHFLFLWHDWRVWVGSVLVLSLFLNIYNIGFQVGYHPDEVKKAIFVIQERQDFQHPLLILKLTRLGTTLFGISNEDMAVIVGRFISALAGVWITYISYKLARLVLPRKQALWIMLAVAVSPILVIHAHYFKEDMLFTAAALTSLYFLARYRISPQWKYVILWGIASGLAFSSHYKSLALIGLYAIAPFLYWKGGFLKYYRDVLIVLLISAAVFLLVNWQAVTQFEVFKEGFLYEVEHAATGHQIIIDPMSFWYTFHWRYSVMPGMTPGAAILGLLAIVGTLLLWRRLMFVDRLLLVFAVMYYFLMEHSPLKPFPDFMRYIIPIVPPLLYMAVRVADIVGRSFSKYLHYMSAAALAILLIVVPLIDSFLLAHYLDQDTRRLVERWLDEKKLTEKARNEAYAGQRIHEAQIWSHAEDIDNTEKYQKAGFVLVSSSFMYDRYAFGSSLEGQGDEIYLLHENYQKLFQDFPYREFKPKYKTFGFSNPTIRIIDLREEGPPLSPR